MSTQYGSRQAPQAGPVSDPVGETFAAVGKVVGLVLLAVVCLPLVVPALALQGAHWYGPTKARYWLVPRWWLPSVVVGAVVVVGLLVWEVVQLVAWVTSGEAAARFHKPAGTWWPTTWHEAVPWLVANLAVGVLLIPAAWAWARRRVAHQVYMRQIDDVVRQEQIERARITAEDWTAAKRAGVRVDPRTGTFVRRRRAPRLTGPRELRTGSYAMGLVTRPTVRTWRERARDRRTAPDWMDKAGRWLLMPSSASAVRALLLAESGTGKTVLLTLMIRAAAAMGWPVVMIDAKGDPADARDLAAALRAAGTTVAVGPRWNLFSGSAQQISDKLMRLLPPGEGAARHYSDEARGVLAAIQSRTPVRSVDDLADRLKNPAPHVSTPDELAQVTAIVDSRTQLTAAARVATSLANALRPLTPYLDADGWTYEKPGADVVVIPLTPVDAAQARLGDLMLMDLRQFMAGRLRRGDKGPALLIVDEFPQLITEDTDPGDVAAALFETARSAGLGLILAGQSVAGLSADEAMRQRALSSGAGLILGRSKDPEAVVQLAGTVMRMEASGEAHSGELRSGRAQHTYVIPPQVVREAWNGRFWLIHSGAVVPFRVLPPAPARAAAAPAPSIVEAAHATGVVVDDEPEQVPETVAAVAALADVGTPPPPPPVVDVTAPVEPEAAPAARLAPRGFSAPRRGADRP